MGYSVQISTLAIFGDSHSSNSIRHRFCEHLPAHRSDFLLRFAQTFNQKITANYQTFTAQDVKVKGNDVQFSIYVGGNPVSVRLRNKDGKLISTFTLSFPPSS